MYNGWLLSDGSTQLVPQGGPIKTGLSGNIILCRVWNPQIRYTHDIRLHKHIDYIDISRLIFIVFEYIPPSGGAEEMGGRKYRYVPHNPQPTSTDPLATAKAYHEMCRVSRVPRARNVLRVLWCQEIDPLSAISQGYGRGVVPPSSLNNIGL